MSSVEVVKRPGIVTLIGVYLWVMAIVSLLAGLVIAIGSQSDDVILETGRTETELLTIGIVELALGVIIVLVAIALTAGSPTARTLVAVVAVLRIAATVFLVVYNHTTGYLVAGLLHVILPIFILWALYGNDKAEAYFDQYA